MKYPLDKYTTKMLRLLELLPGNKFGFSGNFASWQEAQKACTGYNAPIIFEKVLCALRKVRDGQAPYERDSVLFDKIQYSWPLLAGLMWVAAQNNGELNILDFGGSLGTTYFQNRHFLKNLSRVSWSIVEQKHFVDTGRKEFQNERLNFFYDIESCMAANKPSAILLSSSLQYLEKPYDLLNLIMKNKFNFLLIDRTPFSRFNDDRIMIQKVPPSIYNASYPLWVFSEIKFKNYLVDYEAICEFPSLDGEINNNSRFKGFIIQRCPKQ